MRMLWTVLPLLIVGCGDKDDKEDSGDPGGGDTGEVTVTDADGDGYPEEADCDDTNADINPEADEVCDGLDNDCNDLIDDEDPSLNSDSVSVFYGDADGDGYGLYEDTVLACEAPAGYAAAADDCNDTDGTISPGASEVCDDGIDNDCTVTLDCEDTGCTGDTACLAAIDSISPSFDDVNFGTGREVTLVGVGFGHGNAGTTTVTVGGTAAKDVVVVNDEVVTFTSPVSAKEGAVDVVLTNDNGSITLTEGFRYITCLYAATGRGGTAGNLYCISPVDGQWDTIAPLTNGYTGLAFAPDGTLYGATSTQHGDSRLMSVDPGTGAETEIGFLYDSVDTKDIHGSTPDITFVGSRLIGWSESYIGSAYDRPVEFDLKTGVVTQIMTSRSVSSSDTGIASDASGNVFMCSGLYSCYTIDTKTGAGTAAFNGKGYTYGRAVMTFHDGTLYSLDCDSGSSGACNLITIDTKSGAMTTIASGLPTGLDAFASPIP